MAVVGTHQDEKEQMIKEGTCKETRVQKNKKLCNILLPLVSIMFLIMFRHNEVIFPTNMLNPNDDEKKGLKKLRDKIMNSKLFSTYPIPVSWFLLEQDILWFAEERNTKLVLVKDCVKIAAKLLINPEALEVALLYFHSLNAFLYSPEVLHGLVFIDPQFPLHCVFEFVAFQFKLTDGLEEAVNAADVFDIEKGIVTMEMMKRSCTLCTIICRV